MMPAFPTIRDAEAAGYRLPRRGHDIDASGPRSFGYVWQDQAGNRTVNVTLTETRNAIGGHPAVEAMFPPRQEP